jgi:putative Holliday junction resolvase
MKRVRTLGLDFGTKNVGLAASDELGLTVSPLPSVPNRSRRDLLSRIKTIIRERGVDSIVIGLPLNMDGTSGDAVERVRRFARFLQQEIPLPLHEVDERLSTLEAAEVWRGMNARQQRKYRTLDSLAAAFILERYLKEA